MLIFDFIFVIIFMYYVIFWFFFFFFQAEDGIRDAQESRGLGDVYKRQVRGAVAAMGCFCSHSIHQEVYQGLLPSGDHLSFEKFAQDFASKPKRAVVSPSAEISAPDPNEPLVQPCFETLVSRDPLHPDYIAEYFLTVQFKTRFDGFDPDQHEAHTRLCILIDCSGSMGQEFLPGDVSMTKLDMACHLCSAILEEVNISKLCIITYNELATPTWPSSAQGSNNAPQTATAFGDFTRDQATYDEIMATVDAKIRGHSVGGSNLSNAIKLASHCFDMDSSAGDTVTDRLIVLSDMEVNMGEQPMEVPLAEETDLQTELHSTNEDGIPWVERVRRGAIGGIHGDSNSKLWYTTVIGIGPHVKSSVTLPLQSIRGANSMVVHSPRDVLWAYERVMRSVAQNQRPTSRPESKVDSGGQYSDHPVGFNLPASRKITQAQVAHYPALIAHYETLGGRNHNFLKGQQSVYSEERPVEREWFATQVKQRMIFPVAFDLRFELQASPFVIEEVVGLDSGSVQLDYEDGEFLRIDTVFPSNCYPVSYTHLTLPTKRIV
eukprot:TRINITY_DN9780_c0_g1_i4.p1 TRINITY_DN9780_c0_g1~~TRINITY_DN9780_c0_g1_i4.p1  ORF type:complete len:547 (-),score=126.44 TRINITY_DN9780_c0_g1_i4:141-1781(-)